MAVTSISPPTSNATLGTALGDGTTYISWSQPTRMYASGTNVTYTTSPNAGNVWQGCFSSTIPATATILGVELVGADNARFGCAGSTGSSESMTFMMRLYNGSSYSAPLTFLSTPAGGTLNGDSTELTLQGPNKYYVNNTSGTDVLAGASDSLSGLSWDPNDQADFGFVVYTIAEVDSVTGILSGMGDMGLRITYTQQYPNTVISIAPSNILKISGIATASVTNFSSPGNTVEPVLLSVMYQFESETANTSATTSWSPGNSWVNGSGAVDGTYWGRTSNKTVKGWNCDTGRTPSSVTGPDDGVDVSDGSHTASKYLYTESSSARNTYCFVARLPLFNSTSMLDSSNDLDLKFWVHAYGATMGDLYVYIDDASSSNHTDATELAAYESFSGFTTYSSVWQQKTISLNSYRNDTDYYIYFVSQNGTSYTSDLAIDGVQIIESE